MLSLFQTHKFYVGQIVIGKPDDEVLGVKGTNYTWRNRPLIVLKLRGGFEGCLLVVKPVEGEPSPTAWFEHRFIPYKPKDMKDSA